LGNCGSRSNLSLRREVAIMFCGQYQPALAENLCYCIDILFDVGFDGIPYALEAKLGNGR
jgi:hypothetical protein